MEQSGLMAMNKSSTYISFYNKRGTIRIFKKTIRLLGSPKFIRFQIHHEKQMLLLEPYGKITFTSFRVPQNLNDDNGKLDIYSKSFTHLISKVMGWDANQSYRVIGETDEIKKNVIFDLTRAEIIAEENSVNTFSRLYAEHRVKEKLDGQF